MNEYRTHCSLFVWFWTCICMLDNHSSQSPRITNSNKVRNENNRTHEAWENSVYLNQNLNLGNRLKNLKSGKSKTQKRRKPRNFFPKFSSSEFSILSVVSNRKVGRKKVGKKFPRFPKFRPGRMSHLPIQITHGKSIKRDKLSRILSIPWLLCDISQSY